MLSASWNYATKAITSCAGNNDDFIRWDCQKEHAQYQQRQASIDHIYQSSRDWFTTIINADVNNSTFQGFEKWTERGLFAATAAYGIKNVASIARQELNFNGNLQNVKRFLNQFIKNYGSGVFSSNRVYSGIDIQGIAKSIKKPPMRLSPDLKATGAHSVFKKNALNGKVAKYTTFQSQTNLRNPNSWATVKRYDAFGKGQGHYNKNIGEFIKEPHVHDINYPGGVRYPNSWEIPK